MIIKSTRFLFERTGARMRELEKASLKHVDFVGRVEGKALGTGESYCVLPSYLSQVRGLKPRSCKIPTRYTVIAPYAGARIETIKMHFF